MTSGNEGKVHGVKDGKVESNAQHNKKENLNKDNIWVTMWTKVSAWMQQQLKVFFLWIWSMNVHLLASHADILRGSSRVGQEHVTNP